MNLEVYINEKKSLVINKKKFVGKFKKMLYASVKNFSGSFYSFNIELRFLDFFSFNFFSGLSIFWCRTNILLFSKVIFTNLLD